MMSLVFVDGPLNNELLEAEFEGREIDKRDLFAFYNRRINFLWTRASLRNQLLVTATVSPRASTTKFSMSQSSLIWLLMLMNCESRLYCLWRTLSTKD